MRMLVCMYKSHLQTLVLIRPLFSTTFSTKAIIPTNVEDSHEFKISFLKDKCGLSGKPLIRACKSLNFDSSDQRPHLLLELFRSFGFPQPNITRIISSYPRILQKCHPKYIIKPKLDYLLSIFQSRQDVVAIVTKTPYILTRSLTNHLIPSINLLNSVTGSYPNTVYVLEHNSYILTKSIPKSFLLNTQFLLALGVPHSQILKLLTSYGPVLATPHENLRKYALDLRDMGFDLKSSYFCHGIYTLCFVSNSTWKSRCALFRSFGFSNQEILAMFKKMPRVMTYSEKNINEKMDFFLNKLHWTPLRVSTNPAVLKYSLEKRTIPRCSVLQVLVIKNLTSESYMLTSILVMAERKFAEDFVTVHKDDFPEVVEAYQGKLRFDEYTFKQKGQLA